MGRRTLEQLQASSRTARPDEIEADLVEAYALGIHDAAAASAFVSVEADPIRRQLKHHLRERYDVASRAATRSARTEELDRIAKLIRGTRK